MKFSKYHGLGNDFIIVDRLEIDVSTAVALCSRHRGIGADGVLAVATHLTDVTRWLFTTQMGLSQRCAAADYAARPHI